MDALPVSPCQLPYGTYGNSNLSFLCLFIIIGSAKVIISPTHMQTNKRQLELGKDAPFVPYTLQSHASNTPGLGRDTTMKTQDRGFDVKPLEVNK